MRSLLHAYKPETQNTVNKVQTYLKREEYLNIGSISYLVSSSPGAEPRAAEDKQRLWIGNKTKILYHSMSTLYIYIYKSHHNAK